MGKAALIDDLATTLGTKADDAAKIVDDLGQGRARAVVEAAESGTPWKIPALAGAGVGGGLLYRQQDVESAQARAREAQGEADQAQAVRELLNSDAIGADERANLAAMLADDRGSDSSDASDEDSGPLSFLDELGGDGIQGMLFKLILVVIVLQLILNWSEGLGNEIEVGR